MKFGIFVASGIVISVRSFLTKTMTFIDARIPNSFNFGAFHVL